MNSGDLVESSTLDGIHLEVDIHTRLGKTVTANVSEIISLHISLIL